MGNAIHGRDPVTGRAFKADGTVRKERRTLTPEEKIAQIREIEKRAFSTIGQKILSAAGKFSGFVTGLGIFRAWIREARSYGDAEKRAAKRAYYQRMIDTLDAKGEIANNFLPSAADAISTVDGLYSRIGEGYQALVKSGQATPENIEALISENIGDDVREIVESANDPDNDPFGDYRRDAEPNVTATEDSDTL
jgi:hypothetical protein